MLLLLQNIWMQKKIIKFHKNEKSTSFQIVAEFLALTFYGLANNRNKDQELLKDHWCYLCHFVILPFLQPINQRSGLVCMEGFRTFWNNQTKMLDWDWVGLVGWLFSWSVCTSLGGVGMVPQKINLPLILSATKEAISEKTSSSACLPSFLDQESMETNKNFSESFDHKKAPLYFMVRQATFIPDC